MQTVRSCSVAALALLLTAACGSEGGNVSVHAEIVNDSDFPAEASVGHTHCGSSRPRVVPPHETATFSETFECYTDSDMDEGKGEIKVSIDRQRDYASFSLDLLPYRQTLAAGEAFGVTIRQVGNPTPIVHALQNDQEEWDLSSDEIKRQFTVKDNGRVEAQSSSLEEQLFLSLPSAGISPLIPLPTLSYVDEIDAVATTHLALFKKQTPDIHTCNRTVPNSKKVVIVRITNEACNP